MKKLLCLLLTAVMLFIPACNAVDNAEVDSTDSITDENTTLGEETTEEMTTFEEETTDYPDVNLGVTANDGYFQIQYLSESYVKIGESVGLSAQFVKSDGEKLNCLYQSLDNDIAMSDFSGNVTGVTAGMATIRASVNPELYFDFYVTVLPENISDALMLAVKSNNSNIFVRKNLGIGAGTPVYYRDIYGSISQLQYNDALEIDRTYEQIGTENTKHTDGLRSKYKFDLEYITVHYTGNMNVNATAKNNAEYFAYVNEVSVHYVTGNDGVYSCMSDDLISWNAGDRASGMGGLEWYETGVYVDEDAEDITPKFSVSENKKFTINGQETTVKIPKRLGSIKYHGDTFEYKGESYPTINKMGLPWKVVDGQYYMGKTWWSFRASTAGCICGVGGDYNSISIESAVNPETDLWYTWHKTAQLVAKLLVENNLDITRVTGHHMWTQKDCPQPMLENDLEIWYVFLDMVECEYEMLKNFSDCKYTLKVIDGTEVTTDTDKKAKLTYEKKKYTYVQNPGRVIPDEAPHIVVYEVSVETASGVETIKLASAVNSTLAD